MTSIKSQVPGTGTPSIMDREGEFLRYHGKMHILGFQSVSGDETQVSATRIAIKKVQSLNHQLTTRLIWV
jgi:hypothetical protein